MVEYQKAYKTGRFTVECDPLFEKTRPTSCRIETLDRVASRLRTPVERNQNLIVHYERPSIRSTKPQMLSYQSEHSKSILKLNGKQDNIYLRILVGLLSQVLDLDYGYIIGNLNINVGEKGAFDTRVRTTNVFLNSSSLMHLLLGSIRDAFDLACYKYDILNEYARADVQTALINRDRELATAILLDVLPNMKIFSGHHTRRPLNNSGAPSLEDVLRNGWTWEAFADGWDVGRTWEDSGDRKFNKEITHAV